MLSFFSVGFNAAYNREHLSVSQALGESAYITGFGIAQSRFGWTYGTALGEDVVAPGDRETFALVAKPLNNCSAARVQFANAGWSQGGLPNFGGRGAGESGKDKRDKSGVGEVVYADFPVPPKEPTASGTPLLKSVSYSPVEYDPSDKTAKPQAVIDFTFNDSFQVDSEATLTVNGILLKRSRDNFARATTTPAAATLTNSGLLEIASIDSNSWIPLGHNQISITLDPSVGPMRNAFPQIEMSTPSGPTLDLTGYIDTARKIEVSGQEVFCSEKPCAHWLPPIGIPKATSVIKNVVVARFKDATGEKISITVNDPSAQSNSVDSGVTTIQFLSASEDQPWGNPVVLAKGKSKCNGPSNQRCKDKGKDISEYLACKPRGQILECSVGRIDTAEVVNVMVSDPMYKGSPVFGTSDMEECSGDDCHPARIWHQDNPVWVADADSWLLHLALDDIQCNKDGTQNKKAVQLYNTFDSNRATILSADLVLCHSNPASCEVSIPIHLTDFAKVTDDMTMRLVAEAKQDPAAGGRCVGCTRIFNIHKVISPLVTSSDEKTLGGKNLVFNKLQIGGNPKDTVTADCIGGIVCSIDYSKAKADGYLSFVVDDASNPRKTVPVLLVDAKGNAAPIRSPAGKQPPGESESTPPNAPPPPPPPPGEVSPNRSGANAPPNAAPKLFLMKLDMNPRIASALQK